MASYQTGFLPTLFNKTEQSEAQICHLLADLIVRVATLIPGSHNTDPALPFPQPGSVTLTNARRMKVSTAANPHHMN